MFCRSMVRASSRLRNGRDRRQLIADAVAVGQLKACRVLEDLQRAAFDLARDQQQIELAQCVARVGTFQIVLWPEQALAASLALALRNSAQRVKPAGDCAEEALLGLHIGGDRPEQRRLRLVGAVGPPPTPGWRHRPSIRLPADNGRASRRFLAESSA